MNKIRESGRVILKSYIRVDVNYLKEKFDLLHNPHVQNTKIKFKKGETMRAVLFLKNQIRN